MPIVEIMAAIGLANAIHGVAQKLNRPRSVILQVDNNTNKPLTRVKDSHDSGGWAVTPVSVIPAGMADVFGSQSRQSAIFTGTRGEILYQGDDIDLRISWNNPYVGNNSGSIEVQGRDFERFWTAAAIGVGDQNAHMRYEIFENPPIDVSKHYPIIAQHSRKCLDVPRSSLDDSIQVTQHTFHGGDNQQWQFVPTGDDFYQIVAKHSGKCLDVVAASQDDGTPIHQYPFWGGDNQKWRPEAVGNGLYKIIAKHSGKCLDVSGGSQDNLAGLIQHSYGGGDNQKWRLSQ